MSQRHSPYNHTTVPVLDRHGQPLAPARPSRVRKWLESGRATKVWIKGIFAVQLGDRDVAGSTVGHFALNVTPGETSGIVITREAGGGKHRTVVGAYEHQHRNGEIHRNLDDRRDKRRNRRGRIRHRPARFDHRTHSKKEGWLPPSTKSLADDHHALQETMLSLYPISKIRVQDLKFDTQRMQNPDIRGTEYQEGTLQGWHLKHYIFDRDAWTCLYCGEKGTEKNPLTLDHVIPKSKGGPSRVQNLVTACMRCNNKRKKGLQVTEFLANDPEKLTKILHQLDQMVPLTSAGRLNSVMPRIRAILEATGLPDTHCDGVTTAFTRKELGIGKTHVNDAACLDLPERVENLNCPVTVLKRQRRHTRQSINCDGNGSPDSKEFPAYSRLPRGQQGYTTPPAHSVGPRRLHGIRTGDTVRIRQESGETFTGRATLKLKDRRVEIKRAKPDGGAATGAARTATLLAHTGRWEVHLNQPPTKKAQRTKKPNASRVTIAEGMQPNIQTKDEF